VGIRKTGGIGKQKAFRGRNEDESKKEKEEGGCNEL
jgi:hypothetical protein